MIEHDDDYYKPVRPCPVCGRISFMARVGSYEICDCGWQDDKQYYKNPNYNPGGANEMTLNEARAAYAKGEQVL